MRASHPYRTVETKKRKPYDAGAPLGANDAVPCGVSRGMKLGVRGLSAMVIGGRCPSAGRLLALDGAGGALDDIDARDDSGHSDDAEQRAAPGPDGTGVLDAEAALFDGLGGGGLGGRVERRDGLAERRGVRDGGGGGRWEGRGALGEGEEVEEEGEKEEEEGGKEVVSEWMSHCGRERGIEGAGGGGREGGGFGRGVVGARKGKGVGVGSVRLSCASSVY